MREKNRGKYTKTLAKFQDRRILRIRDIRRDVLPKFIEICLEMPCWFTNMTDRNQQIHLLPSFGIKG